MTAKKTLLLVAAVGVLNGCFTYHLIEPVSPSVGNPKAEPDEVTSLQPTLTWKPFVEPGVTYDLVIHEGKVEESFWEGTKREVGERAYYREGLETTSHTVEEPLKPGTEYYWSVRARNGDVVTDWATYDYTVFLLISYVKSGDSPFRFKTPETGE